MRARTRVATLIPARGPRRGRRSGPAISASNQCLKTSCAPLIPPIPTVAILGSVNRDCAIRPRDSHADTTGAGGEGGIRTRDGLPRTAFPVRRHRPLGDLSRRRRVATPTRLPHRACVAGQWYGWRTKRPAGRGRGGRPGCSPVAWHGRRTTGPVGGVTWGSRRSLGTGGVTAAGDGRDDAAKRKGVAERAGFEPAVLSHTAFRERHHQPLGHLSAGEDIQGPQPGPGGSLRTGC